MLRVFEAFAGIGAQRKALENVLSNKYEIVGIAEWYVPAIVAYEAIHNNFKINKNINHKIDRNTMEEYLDKLPLSWDSKNLINKGFWKRKKLDELRIIYNAVKKSEKENNIFDIKNLWKRTLIGIDLLTYSFPCQDLSQQGIKKGMKKNTNTRSGLLWEIEKALDSTNKNNLPKYLLMENVQALMHKNNKKELNEWISKLKSLGYQNSIKVLNAAEFKSPQARRRVFMLSTLNKKVELPILKSQKILSYKNINSILEKEVDQKYFMPALDKYDMTNFSLTKSNINKSQLIEYSSFNSESYIYDPKFTGPTLTASGANSRIKIYLNGKIRKLTPKEAFMYMGFTANDYEKVNKLNLLNEAQKYFIAGNSISIEVLEQIMLRLI